LSRYDDDPPTTLQYVHEASGKPVFVGEFSFTSVDSNLPNSRGARAGHPFATQNDRATSFTRYVKKLLMLPFALGFHWFEFVDEPASGRWPDGEDSNYGVVSIADDPYEVLTQEMTNTNSLLEQWHKQSRLLQPKNH